MPRGRCEAGPVAVVRGIQFRGVTGFLLLKWLHHLSKANWSLSNLASMLRLNLFTYRELTHWLHDPMQTPPLIPLPEQLSLALR